MDDGLLERIRKVFHLAFGVEPQSIAPDTRPVDVPGWDSLGHLELTTGLEREFSITFDVDELMAMENVRDIIRIVSSRCGPRESM